MSAKGSARRSVVIVGGGITGLAAAHALARAQASGAPVEYTVLEASERLGGNVHTEREGGYVLERGPDGFVATKPHGRALCEALGLGSQIIDTVAENRRVYVLHKGRLVTLPEGMMLAAPTRFWPMAKTPLLSLRGKLRVLAELVLPRRADAAARDESIAGFVARRLGREASEVIAEPILSGIYAGDAQSLSIQATFPQLVALEAVHGGLIRGARAVRGSAPSEGPPKSAFHSLPEGMGQLIASLAERVGRDHIRTGVSVQSLTRTGDARWELALSTGDALVCDAVVLAVPPRISARLVERFDEEAAGVLAEVPQLSSAAVYFGYERSQIDHPLDASGVLIPAREGLEITAATFASSKWRGRAPEGRALIRVFLGGARAPTITDRDDATLLAIARRELERALPVRGTPELARLYRYPRANPQMLLGHLARMGRVRARLAAMPGLFAGGAGYEGVGIPDCIKQAESLAEQALRAVSQAR